MCGPTGCVCFFVARSGGVHVAVRRRGGLCPCFQRSWRPFVVVVFIVSVVFYGFFFVAYLRVFVLGGVVRACSLIEYCGARVLCIQVSLWWVWFKFFSSICIAAFRDHVGPIAGIGFVRVGVLSFFRR